MRESKLKYRFQIEIKSIRKRSLMATLPEVPILKGFKNLIKDKIIEYNYPIKGMTEVRSCMKKAL